MPHADDLTRCPGGIGQGSEQVERCMNTELTPDAGHSRCGIVIKRSKHETEANLIKTRFGNSRRGRYVDTQFTQNVSAAGPAGRRATAVLCYRHARAGNYKGRRG